MIVGAILLLTALFGGGDDFDLEGIAGRAMFVASEAESIIEDQERAQQVLADTERIVATLERIEGETLALGRQMRVLDGDVNATEADYLAVTQAYEATLEQSEREVVQALIDVRAHMTPEEWGILHEKLSEEKGD